MVGSFNRTSTRGVPVLPQDFKSKFEAKQAGRVAREADSFGFNYQLESRNEPTKCEYRGSQTACEKRIWTLYGLSGRFETESTNIYDTFIKNGWHLSDRDTDAYFDRESALTYVNSIWSQWQKMEGERLVFEKNGVYANVAFVSGDMARLMLSPGIYTTCIDDPTCKLVKKHRNVYSELLTVEIYTEAYDLPHPAPTRRPKRIPTRP